MSDKSTVEPVASVRECNDNDSPWLVCKPCAAAGRCATAAPAPALTPEQCAELKRLVHDYAMAAYCVGSMEAAEAHEEDREISLSCH